MAKISVIITSFNQEEYLKEAIESVFCQEYKPFEIIICDDCSTKDNSRVLILAYFKKYPRIVRPVLQERNVGIAENRNAGFRAASGDFVTTLDGDDRYLPWKIESEIKILKNTNFDVSYSNQICINEHGKRIGSVRYRRKTGQPSGWIFSPVALMTCPGPREILFPRRVFDEIGFMDVSLETYEDWDFLIRLSARYRFIGTPIVTVEHRIHNKSIQYRTGRAEQIQRMMKILKRAENYCRNSYILGLNVMSRKMIERKIQGFRCYLESLHYLINNERKSAFKSLAQSMLMDFTRSTIYDLLLRVILPRLFVSQNILCDYRMRGPLLIPYYMIREIYHRVQLPWSKKGHLQLPS